MTTKDNSLLFAALIIGGAYFLSKPRAAAVQGNRGVLGTGTLPPNAGTGYAQVAGGIVGTVGNWLNNLGKRTLPPVGDPQITQDQIYREDMEAQRRQSAVDTYHIIQDSSLVPANWRQVTGGEFGGSPQTPIPAIQDIFQEDNNVYAV